MNVTLDEIRAEVERLTMRSKGESNGWTMREIADAWGIPLETTRKRLNLLNKEGHLATSKRIITNIAGFSQPVPVYLFVGFKKPPKAARRRRPVKKK